MLPPGPQRLSLLQVAQWLRRPFPFLEECAERYGETFTVQIAAGMPLMVILSNPDHIREVFAADGDAMHAGEMAVTLKPFLGARSLILLDGAEHMRMRKLMLPPFHGERMHAYGRQMVECTHASVDAWPRGEVFPIHQPMQRVTLDVILRTVFGIDEEGPRERLGALLEELLDLAAWPGLLIPAMQRDLGPWSPWGRFARRAERASDVLIDEIERRRREGTAGRVDILSMLVDARDENGEGLSITDLRDELVTLLVAGHETTATALAWAFRWILASPDVLARLRDEIMGSVEGAEVAPERVARLEYLDAVVRETLRLQPVIPLVGRVLKRPARVGPYELPAGVAVVPSIYLTHRRASLYPEPARFDPERFLKRKYSPSEWLPFGGGIRRCIGAAFALYEMKMVLATVLHRVDLRAAPGYDITPVRRSITLTPRYGTPVIVAARWPRAQARA